MALHKERRVALLCLKLRTCAALRAADAAKGVQARSAGDRLGSLPLGVLVLAIAMFLKHT